MRIGNNKANRWTILVSYHPSRTMLLSTIAILKPPPIPEIVCSSLRSSFAQVRLWVYRCPWRLANSFRGGIMAVPQPIIITTRIMMVGTMDITTNVAMSMRKRVFYSEIITNLRMPIKIPIYRLWDDANNQGIRHFNFFSRTPIHGGDIIRIRRPT